MMSNFTYHSVMLSYWERQSFTNYDHIILGAGLTGISVGIELAAAFPNERIIVLERGLLPTGATTRNAGFACMGSASELLNDLKTHTEEEVVSLFMRRKHGLDLLRARLHDDTLGYRSDGGYELIGEKNIRVMEQLDYLNGLLQAGLGCQAFKQSNEHIGHFGFSAKHVLAMIENTCEGSIDSGKALRSLSKLATEKGVEIKTGASVLRYNEEEQGIVVEVEAPFRRETIPMRARTLTICTNAFSKQLLPEEDVVPGRGQVLITQPIPGLKMKGVFHYDAGYYYFRELDGRVLIGGGRNLDFEGERTAEFGLNKIIQEDLEAKLTEMILPGQPFEVDMRWAGIMAFGATKLPIVKAFSDRVFGAFRMGGMGVALGSTAARDVVRLITQKYSTEDLTLVGH